MNDAMSINVDGSPGLMGRVGQKLCAAKERANKAVCLLDGRGHRRIRGGAGGGHGIRRGSDRHREIGCRENAADRPHQESVERGVTMLARWWRRHARDADCGTVTAEFAVVLPCVAAVAILVLCLGRASIVSMNCQDAAAAGARAMAIDAGGEAKARAAAQTIAGGGSTVSFAANANSVTVVVRCPVAADPTGVLPASVVGKATRYF